MMVEQREIALLTVRIRAKAKAIGEREYAVAYLKTNHIIIKHRNNLSAALSELTLLNEGE